MKQRSRKPLSQRRVTLLTLSMLAVIGSVVLISPGASGQVLAGRSVGSIDDMFTRVAIQVPSFAGMFLDEEAGTFNVLVKGGNEAAGTRAALRLRAELAGDRLSLGRLRVLDADYSFLELRRWYRAGALKLLALDGVFKSDIDERANRLAIGVETPEAEDAVARELPALGIPEEAVEVRRGTPPLPTNSINDRHRPLVGGLQVSTSQGACTLGFVAIRQGVVGFVTNSHCTVNQGGVDFTNFHQPTVSGTANKVGNESVDPPYFTGAGCPVKPAPWNCRYSDAAFIRLSAGVSYQVGRLARPSLGSSVWNSANTLRVVGEQNWPVLGQTVEKIGRSTGRTSGVVDETCVNITQSTNSKTFLCQTSALYFAAEGDSGGPVFKQIPGTNDVTLIGLHWGWWGEGSVFSPINSYNIQDELGPLTTCANYSC